jgi:hypothetical protein
MARAVLAFLCAALVAVSLAAEDRARFWQISGLLSFKVFPSCLFLRGFFPH